MYFRETSSSACWWKIKLKLRCIHEQRGHKNSFCSIVVSSEWKFVCVNIHFEMQTDSDECTICCVTNYEVTMSMTIIDYGSGWSVLSWDHWSLPTFLWAWIDPNCHGNYSNQKHQLKVINSCYHVSDHYISGWPVLTWDHWSLPSFLWAWIDQNYCWNFSNQTHQSKVMNLCYHVSSHNGSGWPVLTWDHNWTQIA